MIKIMSLTINSEVETPKNHRNNMVKNISIGSLVLFVIFVGLYLSGVGTVSSVAPMWISIPMVLLFITASVSSSTWLLVSTSKRLKLAIFGGSLLVIILFFLIQLFIVQIATVEGQSMESQFKNGDRYLVNVLSYRTGDPQRKDVVKYILENGARVGRIIGLPKEKVVVKRGEVQIDGKVLEESYSDWSGWKDIEPKEFNLKEGEYLIMLDKRIDSVMIVNRNQVFGKFTYKI